MAFAIQLIAFLFFTDFIFIWTCQSSLSDVKVSETQELTPASAAPSSVEGTESALTTV